MKLRRSKALVWLHGFVLLVVIALALYGIARGQTQVAAQPSAAAGAGALKTPSAAERARFDELRKAGFDALYSLDYEGARRKDPSLTDLLERFLRSTTEIEDLLDSLLTLTPMDGAALLTYLHMCVTGIDQPPAVHAALVGATGARAERDHRGDRPAGLPPHSPPLLPPRQVANGAQRWLAAMAAAMCARAA